MRTKRRKSSSIGMDKGRGAELLAPVGGIAAATINSASFMQTNLSATTRGLIFSGLGALGLIPKHRGTNAAGAGVLTVGLLILINNFFTTSSLLSGPGGKKLSPAQVAAIQRGREALSRMQGHGQRLGLPGRMGVPSMGMPTEGRSNSFLHSQGIHG